LLLFVCLAGPWPAYHLRTLADTTSLKGVGLSTGLELELELGLGLGLGLGIGSRLGLGLGVQGYVDTRRQGCQPGERRGPGVRLPVCGWRKTGDGRRDTDNGAEAELGVHEGPGDEIEPVEGGRGTWGRVGAQHRGRRPQKSKGKRGVREVVEGVRVRDTGGAGFWDEADMRAIVGEGRGQIEPPETVRCP
jgi:hypothetical protein